MKKLLLYSTLTLINLSVFVSISFAQFVNEEKAKSVVLSLFNERKPNSVNALTAVGIETGSLVHHKGVPAYYVFNLANNSFVIVSADERINPILGYSFLGKFDNNNVPDCLDWLLEQYKEQIYEVVSNNLSYNDQVIKAEWKKYDNNNVQKSGQPSLPSLLSVGPLTTTTWSQGCYYNEQCPTDASLGTTRCGHVPTGCVATAFAQVMKYHNYPAQGLGSNSYTTTNYGTLSANFGATTYNWAAMPNKLVASSPEAAKLLFHAGVAIKMGYTANSSAAYTADVKAALVNKFKYANSAQYVYKSSYSNLQWENLIRTELDAQRIVIVSGSDPVANAGHAFIADGYQGTNSFHINWGWGGSCDGYFLLTALSPSTYSFNTNTSAIIGIKPIAVNVTCPSVSGLSAGSVTSSGALLQWTPVSGSSTNATYNIKYKPTTSTTWTIVSSTTPSKQINGLTSSTSYHYQVQRVCSGTSSSNYSASSIFTTLSAPSINTTITLGTGTGNTSIAPYGTGNMDERTQFIITKSQLVAAGYTISTKAIKSLAFNVSSASSQTMNGFTIKIGHTTSASFASTAFLNSSMATVYSGNKVVTAGWNTHTFTTPFSYDGASNLLIEICWNNSSATTNSTATYSSTSTYQTIYYKTNNASGGVCGNMSGTRSYSRPNMRLVFSTSSGLKMPESQTEEIENPVQEMANLSVYPNPAKDMATIHFDGTTEKTQLLVYDIMGKLIFSDMLTNSSYLLDLEDFVPGIYLIVVQTENENFVKKLIVQKNL